MAPLINAAIVTDCPCNKNAVYSEELVISIKTAQQASNASAAAHGLWNNLMLTLQVILELIETG